MKAIILAAGYSTRLYPFTKNKPKALLPVAGKPIIEYTIEKIYECRDIDEIYITTNDKFFLSFINWHIEHKKNITDIGFPEIEIINDKTKLNKDRLGSIGDLWFTIQSKSLNDDLLVICSDKIFEFSLRDFINFSKLRQVNVNLCFNTGDIDQIRNKHGCVVIDYDGRIVEFQEKPSNPKSTLESIAFYIYKKDMIPLIEEYLKAGNEPDALGLFTQWLCQRKPIYAFVFKENCYDVGTPEAYEKVNHIYSTQSKIQFL